MQYVVYVTNPLLGSRPFVKLTMTLIGRDFHGVMKLYDRCNTFQFVTKDDLVISLFAKRSSTFIHPDAGAVALCRHAGS
jgi:hypothetical protein